jgi:hypothetical protein
LSAKLLPISADRGLSVVGAMDPHGLILGFLDRISENKYIKSDVITAMKI